MPVDSVLPTACILLIDLASQRIYQCVPMCWSRYDVFNLRKREDAPPWEQRYSVRVFRWDFPPYVHNVMQGERHGAEEISKDTMPKETNTYSTLCRKNTFCVSHVNSIELIDNESREWGSEVRSGITTRNRISAKWCEHVCFGSKLWISQSDHLDMQGSHAQKYIWLDQSRNTVKRERSNQRQFWRCFTWFWPK